MRTWTQGDTGQHALTRIHIHLVSVYFFLSKAEGGCASGLDGRLCIGTTVRSKIGRERIGPRF